MSLNVPQEQPETDLERGKGPAEGASAGRYPEVLEHPQHVTERMAPGCVPLTVEVAASVSRHAHSAAGIRQTRSRVSFRHSTPVNAGDVGWHDQPVLHGDDAPPPPRWWTSLTATPISPASRRPPGPAAASRSDTSATPRVTGSQTDLHRAVRALLDGGTQAADIHTDYGPSHARAVGTVLSTV